MASHYKVELGQAIKRRREELGLTQKDLADATHYKEAQTVSRWERGENLPSNLDLVAHALQWTLAEMVAGIQPPNRRVARQFGRAPTDTQAQSQLDRIEANTQEILRLLRPKDPTTAAVDQLEEKLPDSLSQADAKPTNQAPARSGKKPGAGPRTPASS